MSQSIIVSNCAYSDRGGRRIDMTVRGWFAFEIPFTYDPSDQAPLTLMVKDVISQGSYSISPYVGL